MPSGGHSKLLPHGSPGDARPSVLPWIVPAREVAMGMIRRLLPALRMLILIWTPASGADAPSDPFRSFDISESSGPVRAIRAERVETAIEVGLLPRNEPNIFLDHFRPLHIACANLPQLRASTDAGIHWAT